MKFSKKFFCFLIVGLISEANSRIVPKDEMIAHTKSSAVSKEEPTKIWREISQQLETHLQEKVGGTKLKIHFDSSISRLPLSAQGLSFDLIDLVLNADTKHFTAKIIFKEGTQTPFVLRGHFSFLREVAIVKNTIPKGEKIKQEDISWVLREETPYLHQAVLKSQILLPESISRRALESGKVIKNQDLQKPILVKKGSTVSVSYKRNGLSIELSEAGKALEQGAKGDLIHVRNIKTSVKLTAIVVGQNAVQIRQQEDKKP